LIKSVVLVSIVVKLVENKTCMARQLYIHVVDSTLYSRANNCC